MNKRAILAVLAVLAAAVVSSAPVRSDLGGREDAGYIEDGPKNYWTWPTEDTNASANPTTVWTPEIGVWYTSIASDGYSTKNQMGTYTEDSVTSRISSGYAMGVFLPLEAGEYRISCNTDGDTAFRLNFYQEVEGGFMAGTWITLSRQSAGGWYNKTFTVPEGCSLVLLLPAPYNKNTTLTTTDIEIYRID